MAEAAADAAAPTVRRDPEEVAIELLSAQLGATAIDAADPPPRSVSARRAVIDRASRRAPAPVLHAPVIDARDPLDRRPTVVVTAPATSRRSRPRNRRIPSAIAAA